MGLFIDHYLENRRWRHIIFWMTWVAGFTFIQSFGKSYEYYFGWFSYYILTLPIFVTHTYLVTYVLIPIFLTRRLWPAFVLFFSFALYGFSFLELAFSHEFIFKWYPTGIHVQEDYLRPVNVIISGLGNLYIVLVFLAIRTIRNWNRASVQKKQLEQEELQQQIDETISRVQPAMLLYALDQIEKMVMREDPEVTQAIALTSELLNDIMMFHRDDHPLFTTEVELVRKLVTLVSLFRKAPPEVDIFLSGDPGNIRFPPLLLFRFLDLVFREFDHLPVLPEISIEASGFSNMITIMMFDGIGSDNQEGVQVGKIIRLLGTIYGTLVEISWEKHGYGLSLVMNAVHSSSGAVHMTAAPA